MESLGPQKTLLSERLKQRQEQDQAEVEKLMQQLAGQLRTDLQQLVSDELNTTKTAIQRAMRELPEQVQRTTAPLLDALQQAETDTKALRLVSQRWLPSFITGICLALGLLLGGYGVMAFISKETVQGIAQLRALKQQIRSTQATLDSLPNGVQYVRLDGKTYIFSSKMGAPFEYKGKMAIKVE